jgi:hypothetical protein
MAIKNRTSRNHRQRRPHNGRRGMMALVLCIVVIWSLTSAGTVVAEERCNGPYNHQSPGSPEALKKILETHDSWIQARRPKADQINFCGIVLAKLDLKWADLRDAMLRDADLTGSDAKGARLERADLTGAALIGANLQDDDFTDATLMHADLSKANLKGAKLTGAVLTDAIATETVFTRCRLEKSGSQGGGLHRRLSRHRFGFGRVGIEAGTPAERSQSSARQESVQTQVGRLSAFTGRLTRGVS